MIVNCTGTPLADPFARVQLDHQRRAEGGVDDRALVIAGDDLQTRYGDIRDGGDSERDRLLASEASVSRHLHVAAGVRSQADGVGRLPVGICLVVDAAK